MYAFIISFLTMQELSTKEKPMGNIKVKPLFERQKKLFIYLTIWINRKFGFIQN